jgi:RNA polymerase sigma-70 factor (ECF subfamily)
MSSQPSKAQESRSDGELARLVAAGDRQAAAELVGRYQADVRGFLVRLCGDRHLADDLAQDTFVRMLRRADRFDPAYRMRTWLLTIARRLWINQGRRARAAAGDGIDHMAGAEPGPDEQAARHDQAAYRRTQLDRAMAALSDAQRQAITLFYQQEQTVQQIATIMGLPEGTIKSHLYRGRAALKQMLSGQVELLEP